MQKPFLETDVPSSLQTRSFAVSVDTLRILQTHPAGKIYLIKLGEAPHERLLRAPPPPPEKVEAHAPRVVGADLPILKSPLILLLVVLGGGGSTHIDASLKWLFGCVSAASVAVQVKRNLANRSPNCGVFIVLRFNFPCVCYWRWVNLLEIAAQFLHDWPYWLAN